MFFFVYNIFVVGISFLGMIFFDEPSDTRIMHKTSFIDEIKKIVHIQTSFINLFR